MFIAPLLVPNIQRIVFNLINKRTLLGVALATDSSKESLFKGGRGRIVQLIAFLLIIQQPLARFSVPNIFFRIFTCC